MTAWRDQIDKRVVKPRAIVGLHNGDFPDHALVNIHDHTGRVIGRACVEAARAWHAMSAAAWAEGIFLRVTSSADAYRLLSIQKRIFGERYTRTNTGHPGRECGGLYFWKRTGKEATAACPGTSNHGLGLAFDLVITDAILRWLERNAARFGFAWEISSENWHLHYMRGDNPTQAVLDYEAGHHPPTSQEDDDMPKSILAKTNDPADNRRFLIQGNFDHARDVTGTENDLLYLNGQAKPENKFLQDSDVHTFGKVFIEKMLG